MSSFPQALFNVCGLNLTASWNDLTITLKLETGHFNNKDTVSPNLPIDNLREIKRGVA